MREKVEAIGRSNKSICRTTKNVNFERQRQMSTNIPVEPIVEDVERVRVRDQHVDDMVQFQTIPITNRIPKADRQKEYRKRKLNELTAE